MADNVGWTEGSGKTLATDDVSSVHYPKNKLDIGGDGVSVPLVAGQQLAAASVPVVLTALQEGLTGALTETAPATDTASSGLNGRLQRIAQRITSLITALGSPFQAGGSIGNTTFASTQSGTWNVTNVSGTVSLPTGASTETTLGTRLSESDFDAKTGSLTETAPATDTASSGVNGRLQRIAQRITSLITALGSPFQAGGSIGNTGFIATGNAAHDAAVSGNPVLIGGEARDALGTAVATGDVVRPAFDRYGRMFTRSPKTTQASSNGTPITTATDTSVVSAPSAGNHLIPKRIHATNTSSTAVLITWRDGVAGAKRYPAYLPQGGIQSLKLDGSWELTTATALYLTTSAAGSIEWHVDYETVAD